MEEKFGYKELQESQHPRAWQFWCSQIYLKNANNRVLVRAWDSAGNTQPEDVKTIWNFKGYMNNS